MLHTTEGHAQVDTNDLRSFSAKYPAFMTQATARRCLELSRSRHVEHKVGQLLATMYAKRHAPR